MELKNGTAVLFVRDAQRAKTFYETILGFHVVAEFGGTNIIFREGFALWQPMPDHPIPAAYATPQGNSRIHDDTLPPRGEMCYETDDLDSVHTGLKAAGVRFLHEVREEIWGQRTIRFFDPDGHLIEAGESMHVFVRRFRNQGLTPEQIAERTFMPLPMVLGILGN